MSVVVSTPMGFSKVCEQVLKETDCVSCDICHEWFHPACPKLSKSAFSALCHYEFFWSFDICKVKLPDIIEAGKNHISVNNKIDEVVESIEKHQKTVKEQLCSYELTEGHVHKHDCKDW